MLTINLIIILLSMPINEEGTNMLDNMLEYKVVVVGDKGVGKSALVRRFCTDQFVEVNILESIEPNDYLDFFRSFQCCRMFKIRKSILLEAEELSLAYLSSVTTALSVPIQK